MIGHGRTSPIVAIPGLSRFSWAENQPHGDSDRYERAEDDKDEPKSESRFHLLTAPATKVG